MSVLCVVAALALAPVSSGPSAPSGQRGQGEPLTHELEVRYRQGPAGYTYEFREPGEGAYRDLTLAELHRTLAQLKERDPDKLYTKIIIPDDSGLSYSEAWAFTKEILSGYDYYYQ